jgi:hypothetical protein
MVITFSFDVIAAHRAIAVATRAEDRQRRQALCCCQLKDAAGRPRCREKSDAWRALTFAYGHACVESFDASSTALVLRQDKPTSDGVKIETQIERCAAAHRAAKFRRRIGGLPAGQRESVPLAFVKPSRQ